MQKIINQILEGNFEYENGSLEFSYEKIDLSLKKGQRYEGAFHIYAPIGLYTDGKVISSDWRMECLTGGFSGVDSEIFFRFHGELLEEGDVVKGCFYVVSNQGEYYLPFVVSVEYSVLESSMGSIKNLSQFASLAKENWQEAAKLFCSPKFGCIFSAEDAGEAEAYRALAIELKGQNMETKRSMEQGPSRKPRSMEIGNSMEIGHSMEEFLLQAGKKQKVEFFVEESTLCLEIDLVGSTYGVIERSLTIVRNGWGFTRFTIECVGDFLFTDKKVLIDDDFLGNRCKLPVFIDTNFCRRGNHYGQICLCYPYGELNIPVEVRIKAKGITGSRELSKKKYMAQLMKLYQAFRLRKIKTSLWLKETGRLVEGLVAMDENDIAARLFQAQLLITERRLHEAGWNLNYVSDLFEKKQPDDVLMAYYLYLTTLIHGDAAYISQVAEEVERIYRRDISNWRVAWLLLYLSEDYQNSDKDRWQLLEQLFVTGCTSPVLYIEALFLLNNNPALLRKLGEFEQQVIYFGIRQGGLHREIAEQVSYFAGRVKEFSEVLLKILEALYVKMDEKHPIGKEHPIGDKDSLPVEQTYSATGGQYPVEENFLAEEHSIDEGKLTPKEYPIAEGKPMPEENLINEGKPMPEGEPINEGMSMSEEHPINEGMLMSEGDPITKGSSMSEEYPMSDVQAREEDYFTGEGSYVEKERLLEGICTLLIKAGRTGSKYFNWYKAGVEAQLRITNLYEYYMMSMDIDEGQFMEGQSYMKKSASGKAGNGSREIPKTVLMYFSYQSHMDYVRSAYLYDYMLQHEEQLEETCNICKPKMEYFIIDQIQKGHINRHLANLYQKLLRPEMIDERICGPFSRLLFAHLLRVEDSRMQKVYVYQPGNLKPSVYMLTERCTWVALYGSQYTIVFEDAWGNCFLKSVEYTIEKLMIPGKFLRWLLPLEMKNPELDLYLCDSKCIYRGVFHEGIERELRAVASENVDNKLRSELSMRILQYYYDKDDQPALDKYLDSLPAQGFNASQRGEVIKFFVLRGKYDLAGEWVEAYGPYIVDAEVMARLLDFLIEKCSMKEKPMLTAAAAYVFRKGKYNNMILAYLAMYYQGMAKNLRHIWKAARSCGVDCYKLSERILVQMLYSGAFVGEKMDIFRYYVSQGANAQLKAAFLAQCAYDYFVRERVTEKDVFYEIQQMYLQGEPVQKICKLAFLRYTADNKVGVDADAENTIKSFLEDLAEEGVRLEFFKQFKECPALQQELADKTIIEYRTSPQVKARIHYIVPGREGGYLAEYMKEAYSGVFFQEFVLFFGESLQYYITEEQNGEEQLTESGTLQKSEDSRQEENSRYRLVNDIAIRMSLQEFDAMDSLLEEYYKKDFMNGRLFGLR